MTKRKISVDRESLLSAIEERYRQYRKSSGGRPKHYPAELQGLVLSATRAGVGIGAVAKASGVSPGSIYSWRRQRTQESPKVRELKVTAEALSIDPKVGWATIRLKSGVGIELPYSALTKELLSALSGVSA